MITALDAKFTDVAVQRGLAGDDNTYFIVQREKVLAGTAVPSFAVEVLTERITEKTEPEYDY